MIKLMPAKMNVISSFVFIYFLLGVFRSSAYFYESSQRIFLDIGMFISLFILGLVGCRKNIHVAAFFIFAAALFLKFNSLSYNLVTLIFLNFILYSQNENNFKNFLLMFRAPFWGSLTGTLIVIFSSMIGLVENELFIPLTTNAFKKSYGFFNPNVGAIYFSSIFIYLLVVKKQKLFLLPLYTLLGFLVYETHSRTAMLAILISIIFFYYQRFISDKFKKVILTILIITLPLFGLMSYLSFSIDQYYFFLDKSLWSRIDFISSFRLSRIILAYDSSSLNSLFFGTANNLNHELGWLNYIMIYGLLNVMTSALIFISYVLKDKFFTDKDIINYCFIIFPAFIITNFMENLYFSYNLFALMFFFPFFYVLKSFFESFKIPKRKPKNIPDKNPTETSIAL